MQEVIPENKNKRYYLLDSIRGICILGMIVYHTLFDLIVFFGLPVSEGFVFAVNIIRDFGASCFIFLSGICIHFGHRPLKRSLVLSAGGLIITAVTYIFAKDMCVIFGILTFMGIAGLIMIPLKKYADKAPPLPMLIISLIMFILTMNIYNGYIGLYGKVFFYVPAELYKNYFTAFLGFPFQGFSSGDYYPVFPWIFIFFAGFFFWNIIKNSSRLDRFMNIRIKFLEKTGSCSLIIYLIHQPVVLALVYFIGIIFNTINK